MQAAAGLQVVRMMQSHLEGGAIRPPGAPSGVYEVADGWMTITVVRPHEWLGFCKAVDLPAFAADERYRTTQGRTDDAGGDQRGAASVARVAAIRALVGAPGRRAHHARAAQHVCGVPRASARCGKRRDHLAAPSARAAGIPDAAGDRRAAAGRRQPARRRAGPRASTPNPSCASTATRRTRSPTSPAVVWSRWQVRRASVSSPAARGRRSR